MREGRKKKNPKKGSPTPTERRASAKAPRQKRRYEHEEVRRGARGSMREARVAPPAVQLLDASFADGPS